MNQAKRRSLRPWHLLLLFTLLLASAPAAAQTFASAVAAASFRVMFPNPPVAGTWAPFSITGATQTETVPVLAGPAVRFELEVPTQPVAAGAPVRIRVVAFDANNNVATDFTGPILFESTTDSRAILPQNVNFELADRGQKEFDIALLKAGAQKLAVIEAWAALPREEKDIAVMPGPATSLQLLAPTETTAGQVFSLEVHATDAFGNTFPYTGPLQFTSSDRLAFLPTGTVFGPGPFTVALKTIPAQRITATGANSITGTVSLEVLPASFEAMVLSTTPVTLPMEACSPGDVRIRATDRYGNTVEGAREMTLCGKPAHALEYTDHTLTDVRSDEAGCITGLLPASGEGEVAWSNKEPGDVTFSVTPSGSTGSTVTLSWRAAGFSAEESILSFPGGVGTPPSLRTFTGELEVQMELRNACGQRMDLPAGQVLGFKAESPLALTGPAVRKELGIWSTSVRLPKCPDLSNVALRIGPLINDEPVLLPNGEMLLGQLMPLCLPPVVQLEIQAKPKDAKATPGALVEFEVTVSNTGDAAIPEGKLWLDTESVSGHQASIDGAPLEAVDNRLTLPAMEPGATRIVRLQGQAAVQMDKPVSLTAWYTTLKGAALTEKKALSLEWGEMEVDVGQGCQTVPLSSQFLPWLALLAAASRSRSRLRRLTRGERNDH